VVYVAETTRHLEEKVEAASQRRVRNHNIISFVARKEPV
jgi:hypothetical protein